MAVTSDHGLPFHQNVRCWRVKLPRDGEALRQRQAAGR